MAVKNICVFVILGIFLVQCGTGFTQDSEKVLIEKGIIEDVLKKFYELIRDLKEKADGLVKDGIDKIYDLITKISESGESVIKDIKEIGEEIIKNATKTVKELEDKAKDMGVDIADCVKDEKEQFEAVIKDFMEAEIECVKSEIEKAEDIMKNAINAVKGEWDSLTELCDNMTEQMINCSKSGTIAIIMCLKDITVSISQEWFKFGKDMTKLLTDASGYFAGLKVRLAACATSQVANALVDVGMIVTSITKCINDKINAHVLNVHLL